MLGQRTSLPARLALRKLLEDPTDADKGCQAAATRNTSLRSKFDHDRTCAVHEKENDDPQGACATPEVADGKKMVSVLVRNR